MSSMQNKTVIVTGATAGIGLATARALATLGAQVVIISRNAEKCAAVVKEIKHATRNPNVEFIAADLSTLAGIRQAATTFRQKHKRLDVLVNNAGVFFNQRTLTVDGFEQTFALNHLSYFLLTNLLLDVLKTSAPVRIVNVSSGAHMGAQLDFNDLMGAKNFQGFIAYSNSKLANILFTYELARKLEGTRVTVNALHPGFVGSNFAANNGALFKFGMNLLKPFIRGVDKGAETSIYLASSPEVEGVTGKYFTDCKAVQSSPASYDTQAAEHLWDISLKLTGLN